MSDGRYDDFGSYELLDVLGTPGHNGLAVSEADITKQAIEELEQEITSLYRRQASLYEQGKPEQAAELDDKIQELEGAVSDMETDLKIGPS